MYIVLVCVCLSIVNMISVFNYSFCSMRCVCAFTHIHAYTHTPHTSSSSAVVPESNHKSSSSQPAHTQSTKHNNNNNNNNNNNKNNKNNKNSNNNNPLSVFKSNCTQTLERFLKSSAAKVVAINHHEDGRKKFLMYVYTHTFFTRCVLFVLSLFYILIPPYWTIRFFSFVCVCVRVCVRTHTHSHEVASELGLISQDLRHNDEHYIECAFNADLEYEQPTHIAVYKPQFAPPDDEAKEYQNVCIWCVCLCVCVLSERGFTHEIVHTHTQLSPFRFLRCTRKQRWRKRRVVCRNSTSNTRRTLEGDGYVCVEICVLMQL